VDPFSPGINSPKGNGYYEHDCKSAIDERIGLFPARFCLKISGIKGKFNALFLFLNKDLNVMFFFLLFPEGTREQVVIRTCTVTKLYEQEEGGGALYGFSIEQADGSRLRIVSGFISSCRYDGCNRGNSLSFQFNSFNLIAFCFISIFLRFYFKDINFI